MPRILKFRETPTIFTAREANAIFIAETNWKRWHDDGIPTTNCGLFPPFRANPLKAIGKAYEDGALITFAMCSSIKDTWMSKLAGLISAGLRR